MQQNFMVPAQDPLSLDRIRSVLVRLEDTIIFCIIERAQFALNPRIYIRGAFPELKELGFEGSWLEWFLKEIETFHAKARRYTSPDEYPFTKDLPPPLIPALNFPRILHQHPTAKSINMNPSILSFYTRTIVPRITHRATLELAARKRAQGIIGDDEYEDDGNYGSAATIDVELLHAISKRVHYGKFVSESKFQSNPAAFIPHIKTKDRFALEDLITKPAVERALLFRLGKKATVYGADRGYDGEPIRKSPRGIGTAAHPFNPTRALPDISPVADKEAKALPKTADASPVSVTNSLSDIGSLNGSAMSSGVIEMGEIGEYEWKVAVDDIRYLYENWIIPLTKEVEVEYLLHRLDGLSEDEVEELMKREPRRH
ncbi:chorismate mutase aro7 [Tulasnella sp. 418]|nr:chorismate mutase aro7 [Tulasnella sp. 418]